MDLISRKAAIDALNMNGCCGMGITYLMDCDSVPAVPLDKLCEWLAGYAEPAMEAETWKEVLNKWMEEQDAAD